ncbi:MAG: hypothetical protein R2712_32015, partial [Vicinamibacterales bacterium]
MRVTFKTTVLLVGTLAMTAPAHAGQIVREATGASAAAIQAAVDAFRADLGDPNNGNTPGSQAAGRREINWDGGGDSANVTLDPSPMTRFANRGAVFTTPGTGFEISGQPMPEFGEINAGYPGIFAPFSSPRLFTALDTNVLDVWFFVPGNQAVPAAVTGFGAVFTNVGLEGSTRLEFYAPDGVLLYERAVPYAAGAEYLSFLGVSFDAGEVVGRVRIVSGNTAPGPDETGGRDLVVMDDFIYGEPVAVGGLTVTPESGRVFRTALIELTLGVEGLQGVTVTGGRVWLDGADVTQSFLACV